MHKMTVNPIFHSCYIKVIYEEEPMMETVITVHGMMCKHCKATVERVCKAIPGVVDAVVEVPFVLVMVDLRVPLTLPSTI